MNEIPLTHALVADDEPHIGRIIKMKLEQGPFRVTLVYDGREALEVLRREDDIRLVLLDLMMPHMNGWEFRRKQLQDPAIASIPVVLLTGAGNAVKAIDDLHVAATIEKPVELDTLLAEVAHYCT